MPKAVDDFVNSRLSDKSFYPEEDEGARRSKAFSIANDMLKRGELNASVIEDFIPVTFVQLNGPSQIEVSASEDGRLLVFRNAILARVETNSNGDDIDEAGIEALAATIAGTPIDIEHDRSRNVGFYTAGRSKGSALSVDGVVWADRFPYDAAKVKDGVYLQSVEANAMSAQCSKCGKDFASASDYCDHLKNRRKSGAKRKLSGLTASGGALTTRPAGSNTKFDPASIFFVASHQDLEETMKCPKCGLEIEASAAESHIKEEMDKVESALSTALDEKKKFEAQVQAEKTTLQAALDAATKSLEEEKTAKAKAEADAAASKLSARRLVLKAHVSDDDWKKQETVVASMADEAFNLLAASYASRPAQVSPGPLFVLPSGDKKLEPITL